MTSLYQGGGGGPASKQVLAGLRAKGVQLSAITIKQLLEEGLIAGGTVPEAVAVAIDGGNVEMPDGSKKNIAGSANELQRVLSEIETQARVGNP
jgi:hypothetical protein